MTLEITVAAHAFIALRETVSTDGLPAFFDRAYPRLVDVLAAVGAYPAGPARAYYFSPLTETVDIAAAFPLHPEQVAAVEAAYPELVHHVPECEAFTTRHHGSYDMLGRSWQELMEAVRESGRPAGAVCWETYVTEPTPEAAPADMITDLYVTLA
ncbi:MAG: GyrI-like domain-containing protein [Corynebacterium sp.]|uniref:GyrI-like domain-containing protein n=1 Tax=Corynebacterium sp. TaxID=1720 RepID=UPI0026E09B5A|nr:GyrI-like domain-containing protein [Corynebacterium sp.]MDO5669500.1 GyrI-like domain-containing protein [Corynebacterium sp.]